MRGLNDLFALKKGQHCARKKDMVQRTGQPSQVQLEPQLQAPEAQPQLPFMLIVEDGMLVCGKMVGMVEE